MFQPFPKSLLKNEHHKTAARQKELTALQAQIEIMKENPVSYAVFSFYDDVKPSPLNSE